MKNNKNGDKRSDRTSAAIAQANKQNRDNGRILLKLL